MSEPAEGAMAPQFSLPTDQGADFSPKAQQGKAFVLFFYPRDDTSGCTAEAVAFSAAKGQFDGLGIDLAGMSPDTVKSHEKFRKKHALTVTLISDQEKTALDAYGVWKEKSMYGKKYMGVERSTFLIGKDGRILKAWRKVAVPGHVDEVLQTARQLA